MKIPLPSIADQQQFINEQATRQAIATLEENLKAPKLPPQDEIDENQYSRSHLLREGEGWEPPHHDIVCAYFSHLQKHFPQFNSDNTLGELLGTSGHRIREFKQGRKMSYGIWRKLLVITGRAPQDVLKVIGRMG
ncbi:hypothetical protein CFN79_11120 [Chromobacterium vaccinii]|uniref:Uncharacterized protein n=1 Tax=Chromobacterium piscinae TaxID=686831 RepID=A0ABV0H862_9NEIS|nr:hypothetical protein [Chromobacterium vaccinii]AVG16354.1 hypothetical protein CFN79_11120 [Chromobacterium vaccinii]